VYSKTLHCGSVLPLLLLTMVSVNRIYCRQNSSFPFRLYDSQGMFNLGQICKNTESQIQKPTYRHQPVLCSLIKHAVLANQSVRYMETLL